MVVCGLRRALRLHRTAFSRTGSCVPLACAVPALMLRHTALLCACRLALVVLRSHSLSHSACCGGMGMSGKRSETQTRRSENSDCDSP
jgi:hypothetical protein